MKKLRIIALLLTLLILISGCSYQDELPSEYFTGGDEAAYLETSLPDQEDGTTAHESNGSAELSSISFDENETTAGKITETEPLEESLTETVPQKKYVPVYGEYYYDLENVVLYLKEYNELPPNYITKDEARDLGWSGGSLEDYKDGAAIGGDRFGNYEGLLPKTDGVKYTECDIDTDGYSSRGSRRLVYSSNGHYYYTSDHYDTFKEVFIGENNEVTVEE